MSRLRLISEDRSYYFNPDEVVSLCTRPFIDDYHPEINSYLAITFKNKKPLVFYFTKTKKELDLNIWYGETMRFSYRELR